MAADRLSALPDGVLLRILSFLDVWETSRTSVLSRRWRTLWCQQDAIDLYSGSYSDGGDDGKGVGRRLFRDAVAIVGASGRCPVRTLSVTVWSGNHSDYVEDVMSTSPGMDAVLAAPAVQRLEELCIELGAEFSGTCDAYALPPSRMTHRCLRLLELTGCTLGPPGTAVFGCLKTLKMKQSEASLENLQAMLDAAPNLEILRLNIVSFRDRQLGLNWFAVASKLHGRLRCPGSVVDVALTHCHTTEGLDLEAPNVRSLCYKGYLGHFPFASSSPAPNPQHLEVSFCKKGRCNNRPSREIKQHAFFWESIGRFSSLRTLKLKVEYIRDIAVYSDQEDMLLHVFPGLNFLEVEGSCQQDTYGAFGGHRKLARVLPSVGGVPAQVFVAQ